MRRFALMLAVMSSLLLAIVTVTTPPIATDWARLDSDGVYVPRLVAYPWPSYVGQVALWGGIVVGVWFAGGRQVFKRPGNEKAINPLNGLSTREYWVLVPVILLGFWLRVHTLADLPLIVDEIGFAAHASDILHGQHVPMFAPGHNANPSVYSWLLALAMSLFGQNTFAIRLIPLVFGTLSIPAVYLLGRAWWSARVGLVAAAFLATYPAHVFFSRMSLYNIVDPVVSMLALAALGRALRNGNWRDYVFAGMMAAMAQYFYHGARLVLVLMGLLAVGCWLLAEEKTQRKGAKGQRRKAIVHGLAWMTFAFVALALPRFAPALVGGLPLEGNREVMRLPADFFPDNTLRAALAWVGQPDVSPFWLSDAPLLLLPALVLFLVGLATSIRRWRDARYAVLVCSVVLTTVFGGAIWTAAPLYVRYMTAAPATALLVAVGLSAVSSHPSARLSTAFAQLLPLTPSSLRNFLWSPYTARGRRTRLWTRLVWVLMIGACLHGIVVSAQHPGEARERITMGPWWADAAAREAANLPGNASAVITVPPEFGEVERITLADYLAAYGLRRAVAVSSGQAGRAQLDRLPEPIIILAPGDD